MTSPFSPLIGGFEAGTVPAHDGEHNLLETTRHLPSQRMRQHYEIAKAHGMTAVRDGLLDGGAMGQRMLIVKDMQMQVIWDVIHFHPLTQHQAYRYGVRAAEAHRAINGPDTDLWLCPLNEIETHAWMRGTGVQGAVDLWHAVRDGARSVLGDRVRCVGSCVMNDPGEDWSGIDAITDACEVIGINVYPHTTKYSVSRLLHEVHGRTGKPVMITETGFHTGHPEHRGSKRGWLEYVLEDVEDAKSHGIPYWGTTIYPLANCTRWDRTQDDEWDHGLIRLDGSVDEDFSKAIRELTITP